MVPFLAKLLQKNTKEIQENKTFAGKEERKEVLGTTRCLSVLGKQAVTFCIVICNVNILRKWNYSEIRIFTFVTSIRHVREKKYGIYEMYLRGKLSFRKIVWRFDRTLLTTKQRRQKFRKGLESSLTVLLCEKKSKKV